MTFGSARDRPCYSYELSSLCEHSSLMMERSRPCREGRDKARNIAPHMKSPAAEDACMKSEIDGLEHTSGAYRRASRRSRSCWSRSRSVIPRRYLNFAQRRELARDAPLPDRNHTYQTEAENSGHERTLVRGLAWRGPSSGDHCFVCHLAHVQQRLPQPFAYETEAHEHHLFSYPCGSAAVMLPVPLEYVLMPLETLKQRIFLPPWHMDDSCFQ